MTEAQIQDIYSRLDNLTTEVNSLKTQIGVVGTTQYAVVQILDRLERIEETTNNNFAQVTQRFERIEGRLEQFEANTNRTLASHTVLLEEVLRILRDRNGGSGL